MPLWIVIVIILALLSLLSYGKLAAALFLHLALFVFRIQTELWDEYPTVGEPYGIPRTIVQLTLIIFILLFEFTPLKIVIRKKLKLVIGLFLLGISLYWVGKPYIVALDVYAYTPVTLALIAGLPLLGAVILSRKKQRGER